MHHGIMSSESLHTTITQGISEAAARQGLMTAADSGDQPSDSVPIPACDKDEELRDYRC